MELCISDQSVKEGRAYVRNKLIEFNVMPIFLYRRADIRKSVFGRRTD